MNNLGKKGGTNRKIVQDIVPSDRRTIRNVSMDDGFNSFEDEHESEVKKAPKMRPGRETEKAPERNIERPKPVINTEQGLEHRIAQNGIKGSKKRKLSGTIATFAILFIAIVVIAGAFSLLYSKAVVTVTPRTSSFSVANTYTARKDASAPDLAYEVFTSTSTKASTVASTNGPLLDSKAKGTVTLYNQNPAPQKIIAGTRLSNSDGLIYRTSATVVIPSKGSISVTVIADKSGADYNMPATDGDMKIVAYKGSDKYSTVFAKAKTNFTGGVSGYQKIVSDTTKSAVTKSLEDSIKADLLVAVAGKITSSYQWYKDAYTIDYKVSDPVYKDAQNATISVTGKISAVAFKKDSLVKYIAGKEVENFTASSYDIKGLNDLSFSIANKKDFSPTKSSPLIFNLKGQLTLVGTFTSDTLKNDLEGRTLKESAQIFNKYPSISNAYAIITPFWMRSFPNSKEKITINLKSE